MQKFLACSAVWAMSILLSIGVLMYGWGLEPQSWWWIIGGGSFGRALVEAFNHLSK